MRNYWWDWLKLVAAWAMLCDHVRFVDGHFSALVWIGRIAFPIFGVIAAENFRVSRDREKYLSRLIWWGAVSEVPFHLLTGQSGNILLLFAFAFSAFHYNSLLPLVGAAFCAYGVQGAASLVLWCVGGSRSFTVLGGLIANPFPLGWISGAASMFPGFSVRVGRPPFEATAWLWWFYPIHLTVLYFCKIFLC